MTTTSTTSTMTSVTTTPSTTQPSIYDCQTEGDFADPSSVDNSTFITCVWDGNRFIAVRRHCPPDLYFRDDLKQCSYLCFEDKRGYCNNIRWADCDLSVNATCTSKEKWPTSHVFDEDRSCFYYDFCAKERLPTTGEIVYGVCTYKCPIQVVTSPLGDFPFQMFFEHYPSGRCQLPAANGTCFRFEAFTTEYTPVFMP